jgi:hypothetical protein
MLNQNLKMHAHPFYLFTQPMASNGMVTFTMKPGPAGELPVTRLSNREFMLQEQEQTTEGRKGLRRPLWARRSTTYSISP